MKKLGKKVHLGKETIEAYCSCACPGCSCNCSSSPSSYATYYNNSSGVNVGTYYQYYAY